MHDRVIKEDGEHYRVYRLLDENNNILYIGKSKQMKQRVVNHLRGKSNIPKECCERIKRIEYLNFVTECDMNIFEIYAISYYKPPYNKECKSDVGIIKIDIPKVWNYLDFDTFKENNVYTKTYKNINEEIKKIKFNKEILLNTDLSTFLKQHYNHQLSSNELNKLLEICNMKEFNIDDMNNYICYNDPKAILVNNDGVITLKRLNKNRNGFGSISKVRIKNNDYYMFRYKFKKKRKDIYGKTKTELIDKIDNLIKSNNIYLLGV